MRTLLRAVPAATLALLAGAACAEPDVDAAGDDPLAEPVAEAPAAAEPMDAMTMDMTVTLGPVNDSGVSGEAIATHGADSVTVVLTVSGLEAGTEYPAHVHQGTCETGGGVAAPLQSVTGGADGTGTSTTIVSMEQLSGDAGAFVQVHGAGGQPVACGDVPGHG